MKTVCLKVNVSSAKTNILFDGAIIVQVKLVFLSCNEIPDEPSHEIMILFVLSKLILQTCMHSHPVGLDV